MAPSLRPETIFSYCDNLGTSANVYSKRIPSRKCVHVCMNECLLGEIVTIIIQAYIKIYISAVGVFER